MSLFLFFAIEIPLHARNAFDNVAFEVDPALTRQIPKKKKNRINENIAECFSLHVTIEFCMEIFFNPF